MRRFTLSISKYNILTVCNETYSTFLRVWVRSLYDKLDLNRIENIYVVDTGMSQEQRALLTDYEKVSIIQTNINSTSKSVHDEGWKKSTFCKLPFIKDVLVKDNIPCVFVDVDCIFNKDFSDLIDSNVKKKVDFIGCDTTCRGIKSSSSLIGSFYVFLNSRKKTIRFLEDWYDKIKNDTKITTDWRESPALTKIVTEYQFTERQPFVFLPRIPKDKPKILITLVSESLMCRIRESEKYQEIEAFIYHMKSDTSSGLSTVEQRLNSSHVKGIVEKYLYV